VETETVEPEAVAGPSEFDEDLDLLEDLQEPLAIPVAFVAGP
jgi:hypothetical protein